MNEWLPLLVMCGKASCNGNRKWVRKCQTGAQKFILNKQSSDPSLTWRQTVKFRLTWNCHYKRCRTHGHQITIKFHNFSLISIRFAGCPSSFVDRDQMSLLNSKNSTKSEVKIHPLTVHTEDCICICKWAGTWRVGFHSLISWQHLGPVHQQGYISPSWQTHIVDLFVAFLIWLLTVQLLAFACVYCLLCHSCSARWQLRRHGCCYRYEECEITVKHSYSYTRGHFSWAVWGMHFF